MRKTQSPLTDSIEIRKLLVSLQFILELRKATLDFLDVFAHQL